MTSPKKLLEELIESSMSVGYTAAGGYDRQPPPGYFIEKLSPEDRTTLKQLTSADCQNVRTDWFTKFVRPKANPWKGW